MLLNLPSWLPFCNSALSRLVRLLGNAGRFAQSIIPRGIGQRLSGDQPPANSISRIRGNGMSRQNGCQLLVTNANRL
jgi:hypothetical protein